ncbi:enoyl-CoA delta isomerase 1, mitochondrial-like isoform X2 [Amphiura filiformis]
MVPHLHKTSSRCVIPISSVSCQHRLMTNGPNFIRVEKDDTHKGVSVIKMDNKPVNSLSTPVLMEMANALDKLESDSSCRGVILTSANPGIFSAGLDIFEMYQKSPDQTNHFWKCLQEVWLKLYGSSLVTIAAINGHSPAGGCLMAMSCDYRVMSSGKFTIGLNETLLGIVAPFWFSDTMLNTIGHRQTEKALQLGSLFKVDQALDIGLIDQVAEPDQIMEAAKTEMTKWLKIPDHARILTKQMLRGPTLEKLQTKRDEDVAFFTNFIQKEYIQKSLGMYLESLKKRQK